MPSENEPVSSESQPPVKPDDGAQRAKKLDPGTLEPGEGIQINLKKFSLVLGVILIFALIAGAITEFGP
jgi:hypothetical protein